MSGGNLIESSAARHHAVLESALDAIVTMDATGRVVEFNPAAERMFGHAAEEVLGRDMAELVIPERLREAHRRGLANYLETGVGRALNQRLELTALRADGSEFPIELAITRIDVPGEPLFTGHIRDITDRLRQEAELRRSRARLVEAADEARRRIERDLHDGAQQRLVALGLDLGVAREQLATDPAAAAELLDAMAAELQEAIAELRELARGIHPAMITRRGLAGALRGLAGRSRLALELVALPEERYSPAIETTVWFLVCEALANATRYAGATRVRVEIRREGDVLVVEVADDGAGGADPDRGSGLRGLADRVAALDGTLAVISPPGAGTLLRAELPCGS